MDNPITIFIILAILTAVVVLVLRSGKTDSAEKESPTSPHGKSQISSDSVDYYIENLRSGNEKVRGDAALILREFGTQALQPLISALKDRSRVVRIAACFTLGSIGDPQAVTALASALRRDMYKEVRLSAIRGLVGIGGKMAISILRTESKNNNMRSVRDAIELALETIPDLETTNVLGGENSPNRLLKNLS